MISMTLARDLRDTGLAWKPQLHDFFAIPDRDLDGRVFVLADMSIDVQVLAGQALLTFNGAVEWSLDYIHREDVVWLPNEAQLRGLLGDALLGLERAGGRYLCKIDVGGESVAFESENAADAYGTALLDVLRRRTAP